jgi:hypothetical protein
LLNIPAGAMVDFSCTSHFYRNKTSSAFTADGGDSKENIMLPTDTLQIKFTMIIMQRTLMIVMISK